MQMAPKSQYFILKIDWYTNLFDYGHIATGHCWCTSHDMQTSSYNILLMVNILCKIIINGFIIHKCT